MFRKILIPTDGSAVARKAVNGGVAFAKAIDAAVVAYCATEPIERIYYAEGSGARPATVKALERRYVEQAQRYLDEIARKARAAGIICETVITRPATPHQGILAVARSHKCDAIFMSSHGRGGIASLILGSVTQKVLAHSSIPVIVYP